MNISEVKKNAETKMSKSVDSLKADLAKVRTGRANPGILDHVQVDYYGNPTPSNQVANISLIDGRTISVQPWEKKMVNAVEKAIRDSDLGLNPSSVGDIIRVPMPPLTEERRKELAKQCKGEAENAKVSVRNARRDAIDALKKQIKEGLPEDAEKDAENDAQKLHDKYVKRIDEIYAAKEKEIMTV